MGIKHIETEFSPIGTSIRGMTTASGATARELVYTRSFNAPRESVFGAWTEPKKLARWWGPHGMTNPVCNVDLRPGGRYRIVMRAPNGVEYPLKGEFREVLRPARLIFTVDAEEHPAEWHAMLRRYLAPGSAEKGLHAVVTVTFEKSARGTDITILNEYDSVEIRDAVVKMGSNDGWAQSLERLEFLLKKTHPKKRARREEHDSARHLSPRHHARW